MATKLPGSCESHFLLECRVCSRPLKVPKMHLDELVVCRHCNFEFVAFDPSLPSKAATSADFLIHRADVLIERYRQRCENYDSQFPF